MRYINLHCMTGKNLEETGPHLRERVSEIGLK